MTYCEMSGSCWRFPMGLTACTYLGTEAVANRTDLLHTESLARVLDGGFHDGVHVTGLVIGEPRGEVGLAGFHGFDADLVTLKQVWDEGKVAIVGELVGEELGIGVEAEDIGQEDNGLLGSLVVLGESDIGIDLERNDEWLVHMRASVNTHLRQSSWFPQRGCPRA